jgi:hypothetical protein
LLPQLGRFASNLLLLLRLRRPGQRRGIEISSPPGSYTLSARLTKRIEIFTVATVRTATFPCRKWVQECTLFFGGSVRLETMQICIVFPAARPTSLLD